MRDMRIGLLTASVHTGASLALWPPLVAAAAAAGLDLYVFPGGRLAAADPDEALRNRVFDLADAGNLDGLLSWASSLGGFVGPAGLDAFHDRFGALPLVAMAHRLPGRPVVRIDAYAGMASLLEHFGRVHGVRRCAFLRGPAEHESAEDRYRAYLDFHARAGLPVDERLVAGPRPWNAGRDALLELLDGRGLLPGRDFQALVAASDLQLYAAVLELQARGFAVPQDLLVAGFNDSVESRILSPPVTTVAMPFAEQAGRAFAALLALLQGEPAPDEELLSCRLVVRRSCGCQSAAVEQAGRGGPDAAALEAAGGAGGRSGPRYSDAAARRHRLVAAARPALADHPEAVAAWLEPLAEDLAANCAPSATGAAPAGASAFLATLERIGARCVALDRPLEPWQTVLSCLRAASGEWTGAAAVRAAGLIDQGRVILSETAERAHTAQVWRADRQAQAIRDLEKDLIRAESRAELTSALAARLPGLGIPAAYLIEEDSSGAGGNSGSAGVMIAGFDERGVLAEGEPVVVPAGALLPPGFPPSGRGRTWIVEPLAGNGEYYGRLVLRAGPADGGVYEELRAALTSALQGLRTVDELRRARAAAEQAQALKARFLANVSGELRQPLDEIVAGAERAQASLPRSGGRVAAEALAAIAAQARRQLRVTDDLLDLARSEVGELALVPVLLRPERLLEAAAAEGAAVAVDWAGPLPLIRGDADRLIRLIVGLVDARRPSALRCSVESTGLRLAVSGPEAAGSVSGAGNGGAEPDADDGLARRLAAAHGGIIERAEAAPEAAGPAGSGAWILRLPFPNLAGGSAALGEPGGAVVRLVGAPGERSGPGEGAVPRPAGLGPGLTPAELLVSGAGPAALLWDWNAADAAPALAVQTLLRAEAYAQKPCLVIPDGRWSDASRLPGLNALTAAAAGKLARAAVHVAAVDAEDRARLVQTVAAAFAGDVLAAADPAELAARLVHSGLGEPAPALVVLRAAAPFLAQLRAPAAVARPPVLVLCGRLRSAADIADLAGEASVTLVNDEALTPTELGGLIRARLDGAPALPPFTGALVKQAVLYLNLHAAEALSRWKLAEAVNVSEDYLARIFRRELGLSPWEYLARLRVGLAKQLLRSSGASIREIAAACGFPDQAYFCRVFRRAVGRSPSTYRSESVN
jgi:DNA-binding LacI/PurR family transcriptional regulator/AraC-like DNA-binding protein